MVSEVMLKVLSSLPEDKAIDALLATAASSDGDVSPVEVFPFDAEKVASAVVEAKFSSLALTRVTKLLSARLDILLAVIRLDSRGFVPDVICRNVLLGYSTGEDAYDFLVGCRNAGVSADYLVKIASQGVTVFPNRAGMFRGIVPAAVYSGSSVKDYVAAGGFCSVEGFLDGIEKLKLEFTALPDVKSCVEVIDGFVEGKERKWAVDKLLCHVLAPNWGNPLRMSYKELLAFMGEIGHQHLSVLVIRRLNRPHFEFPTSVEGWIQFPYMHKTHHSRVHRPSMVWSLADYQRLYQASNTVGSVTHVELLESVVHTGPVESDLFLFAAQKANLPHGAVPAFDVAEFVLSLRNADPGVPVEDMIMCLNEGGYVNFLDIMANEGSNEGFNQALIDLAPKQWRVLVEACERQVTHRFLTPWFDSSISDTNYIFMHLSTDAAKAHFIRILAKYYDGPDYGQKLTLDREVLRVFHENFTTLTRAEASIYMSTLGKVHNDLSDEELLYALKFVERHKGRVSVYSPTFYRGNIKWEDFSPPDATSTLSQNPPGYCEPCYTYNWW